MLPAILTAALVTYAGAAVMAVTGLALLALARLRCPS